MNSADGPRCIRQTGDHLRCHNLAFVRQEHEYVRETEFRGYANFAEATFAWTSYRSVNFSSKVNFRDVKFPDLIYFVNAKFGGEANFVRARFEAGVPDFRGATMHEATEWHDAVWPKPSSDKAPAYDQVYAYERLKQEMERLKKHEDEQQFFRRELRARRGLNPILSGKWLLNLGYQLSSDYGNSVIRPVLWLFGIFFAGAVVFARAPIHCGASMPIRLSVERGSIEYRKGRESRPDEPCFAIKRRMFEIPVVVKFRSREVGICKVC